LEGEIERAAAIAAVEDPIARAGLERLDHAMRRDGYQREDPIREVFGLLGDRWSMLILLVLRTGVFRHASLRRLVSALGAEGGISQRVLTLKLRALERDGFVLRHSTEDAPPRVDYRLSEMGAGLVGEADRLFDWIRTHRAAIAAARADFTERGED